MSTHNDLGTQGEIKALEYLLQKGYTILEINWRYGKAEIDLIASYNNTLVFVEVKTRSGNQFGNPESSINKTKQKLMAIAAEEYQEQKNIEMDLRFDIISIILINNDVKEILHFEDAFFPYE